MDRLPIDPRLPEIICALRGAGAVVVVSPPGSGKTTRVPPAIVEAFPGAGRVIVLEPRRIAARAAAARIAEERGWTVGREVGYQVRFETRASRETRLLVVTEGILTRMLQGDPLLEGVAAVLLDEFHERSIHADFALALLREVRGTVRPDLRLAVMSATLDPEPVARFLGGAPVVRGEGRPHPVEVRYLTSPPRRTAPEEAAGALRGVWGESRGHALLFFAGMGEIRAAARELEDFARAEGALVAPLHGSLTLEEQDLALRPTPQRKIVLATNVAETSLTIEGVDLVIDGGHARVLRHDPRSGTDRLELRRISRSSAEQRAGRAGRTGPGIALRLWTRGEQAALEESEAPEILRVDLARAVLELRSWGVADPRRFGWFEAPTAEAIERAEELLLLLGAVAARGGPLTATGKAMLALPAHPRLARIVVAAHAAGRLREGAALAAILEERDLIPFAVGGAGEGARGGGGASGPSDLLFRLELLEEAEREGFRRGRLLELGVDAAAARAAARARDALVRSALEELGSPPRAGTQPRPGSPALAEAPLLRAILLGYPDRVARRRSPGNPRALLVGGTGVVLARESVVRAGELLVAVDLDASTRVGGDSLIRQASLVEREWIVEEFPGAVEERSEARFDEKTGRVRATEAVSYRGLPLEEPREVRPRPEEAARLLAAALRPRAEEIFLADEEARGLILRVRWLREWMPELALPALDAGELSTILAEAAPAFSSLEELQRTGLEGLLRGRLPHTALAALEKEAPRAIRVPGGREVPLLYEPGKPPVLAARVQEMFGLHDTPALAAGRARVILHLLGPNNRPVQITQDLRSFWGSTYAQVRKDLRARYPRHAWPEDPWSAAAESKPKRKR